MCGVMVMVVAPCCVAVMAIVVLHGASAAVIIVMSSHPRGPTLLPSFYCRRGRWLHYGRLLRGRTAACLSARCQTHRIRARVAVFVHTHSCLFCFLSQYFVDYSLVSGPAYLAGLSHSLDPILVPFISHSFGLSTVQLFLCTPYFTLE